MSLQILCIGDPHFKADNTLETQLMETQLRDHLLKNNYRAVVVLGDTFHTNEKLNLHIQKRVISFFKMLKDTSRELFIIVGNHDRPNNNVFMTDDHPFTSLKEWGNSVHIIDKTETFELDGGTFIFVPYVPVGRLEEALTIGGHSKPYKNISCIFAHQEFIGCQMGAIKSEHGDVWEQENPLCVSGHIHDYAQLHPNMIYPGTPIQHNFTDREDKSLSIFTFDKEEKAPKYIMSKHERFRLDIPSKLVIKLTPEELLTFIPPPKAKVRIKVMGDISVLKTLMQTQHVKDLKSMGVRIDALPTNNSKVQRMDIPEYRVKTSFQSRILNVVHKKAELKLVFNHLFPSMVIADINVINK